MMFARGARRAPVFVLSVALLLLGSACGDSGSSTDSTVDGKVADGGDGGADAGDGGADAQQNCPVKPPPTPGACAQDKLEVFKGQHLVVMNTLELGGQDVGFDLNNADCDDDNKTGADNVLWPIGVLAKQSIDESMANGEIVLPIEFYGLDDVSNDDCVNFSIYLGRFPPDADGDDRKAGGPLGKPGPDCNDTDANISDQANEVAGNGVDDNCDGLADEDNSQSPPTPSNDTTDADGDGQTIADGDCDDRPTFGLTIKKGATEICGDGLDNDCNGKADDGCLPWSKGQSYPVESGSLNSAQDEGAISFRGATVKNGLLRAGPSRFSVSVEVARGAVFDLNLTNVFVEAKLKMTADGLAIDDGLLGGVLSAAVMDAAPNLIAEIGSFGSPEDSLLDALVGPAGQLLALPTDPQGRRIPDVDVDGDGIERFIDNDLDGDTANFRVDTCIDGDGTVVKDEFDSNGKVTKRCTEAVDSNGKPRFVDGWSISIKFSGLPSKIKDVVQPKN